VHRPRLAAPGDRMRRALPRHARQTNVYPREVVEAAFAHNAAAVISAHKHPSGAAEPRRADELLTQSLKQALAVVVNSGALREFRVSARLVEGHDGREGSRPRVYCLWSIPLAIYAPSRASTAAQTTPPVAHDFDS